MAKEICNIALGLSEEQRQVVLMALAHLACERPGWDYMLTQIAFKMDNEVDGKAEMYEEFKRLHYLTGERKKQAFELFHKLWGQNRDGVYDKPAWSELLDLLGLILNYPQP